MTAQQGANVKKKRDRKKIEVQMNDNYSLGCIR